MELRVTPFGRRAVRIVLVGDIDIPGAEQIALPLAALSGSETTVVVDMARVDRIAAIGINQFVLAARTLGRGGGRLFLLNPRLEVQEALVGARVPDLLPIIHTKHHDEG